MRHFLFPPIFANCARVIWPSTDDGKTVRSSFFPANSPQQDGPLAPSLHGANARHGYTGGWPTPMRFMCESFSSIGKMLHEKMSFKTINLCSISKIPCDSPAYVLYPELNILTCCSSGHKECSARIKRGKARYQAPLVHGTCAWRQLSLLCAICLFFVLASPSGESVMKTASAPSAPFERRTGFCVLRRGASHPSGLSAK